MVLTRFAESTKIYDVIEIVNEKALSEKQGGGRPPFWEMVFWWTRKPLVGARAAILSCLLPDTAEKMEFLRMIGGKLKDGKIEGTPHRLPPNIPEKYEPYIKGKKLLDPFAGFGSIPLEAMRLGLDVTAVELLPTAYVFLKAVLEYPAKYGKQLVEDVQKWGEWVVERLREDPLMAELYDEDVAVYIGSWEVKCPHCGKWTPIVGNWWLARVRDSKGNYKRLAFFRPVKAGDGVKVEVVDLNSIHRDVSRAKVDARRGTIEIGGTKYEVPDANIYARGSKAWCLQCGMEIRFVDENGSHFSEKGGRKDLEWYVKWALRKYNEGDERFARQRLLVRVKVEDGDLVFEPADERDNEKLEKAKEKVRELVENGDPDVPLEEVAPYERRTLTVRTSTGADTWYKLFNPRQLLTLVKLVKLIREVGKKVEQDKIAEGWSEEEAFGYAEAVATYLAVALCKYADFNSLSTRWNPGWLKFEETLSTRGIAMMWSWVDVHPFAEFTGSIDRSLNNASNGLDYIVSSLNSSISQNKEKKMQSKTFLDDATTLSHLGDEKFDLIVTDPPYADDVPYTELSDFYYVWLKRALSDSDGRKLIPRFHRDAFFKKVGAKYREIETQWQEFARKEISTNPGRFLELENRKEYAEQHFTNLFTQAMVSIRKRLKDDGLAAIYFAHTSFDAWALLLDAIRKAGFKMTGAFPTTTESKDRVTGRGKMTMDTSIVVVCRQNPEPKEGYISEIIPKIRESAERYAKTLSKKNIPGRDVLIGTMVGAIISVTEYSRILSPSGELSLKKVLEDYVYPVVGTVLSEAYGGVHERDEKERLTNPYSLFYLLAKIAFGGKGGTNPFTSDDVITLCRASRLDTNSARELLIEQGRRNETEDEEEEEGGSSVASSKTVKLAELRSKEPVKIKSFLLARGISPDSAVIKLRNPVDAYHLLLYYAAAFDDNRIRVEFRGLREQHPEEVDEAYRLLKIVARMKNGVEMELARRFIQAVEGVLR
ncbi:DUF1156 domain-containing protein [Archaeoglobus sp.]|uniref:DUF1156 domain-containing protein n=1 Tax=Archaeoglobus sp. TaxID=1872626 RepID=UPI0024AA7051|nr:DUF1156 domain-containing protein [Archaeoglobus sp.]MDI3498157.1 putative methylase [Archaeoglobus sp.]